jgi:hypothetical protein
MNEESETGAPAMNRTPLCRLQGGCIADNASRALVPAGSIERRRAPCGLACAVIASNPALLRAVLDCFVAFAPRNDERRRVARTERQRDPGPRIPLVRRARTRALPPERAGKNEQTDRRPAAHPEGRRLHGRPSNSGRSRCQTAAAEAANHSRRAPFDARRQPAPQRAALPDRQGQAKRARGAAAHCRLALMFRAIFPSCRLAEGPVGPPPLTLVCVTLVRVASLSGAWNRPWPRANAANRSAGSTAARRFA